MQTISILFVVILELFYFRVGQGSLDVGQITKHWKYALVWEVQTPSLHLWYNTPFSWYSLCLVLTTTLQASQIADDIANVFLSRPLV